ncbi:MAG: hypothetical protein MJZ66_07030 [Bacteroidales bacterium]|nr:hypothetical protein [Bacteroidales bacterium]
MKKVLLTAAILFAGTFGFYSCNKEEEPSINTDNNPSIEEQSDKKYSDEGIEDELDPVVTGPDRGSESFPASFFQKDENTGAIIDLGRSFHINYPYTNTEMCFTEGSRNQYMEKKKEGNNTKVDIFYTSNDYEYNTLKTNEYSGGIGFGNTFQLDANRLTQFTTSTTKNTERLVFIATVDYGQYYYAKPLVLTKEANALLKANKFDEFKTKYGTHYVMGCERIARIVIEIEKKVDTDKSENAISNNIHTSLSFKGWNPDFSWKNNKNKCTISKDDEIEIKTNIEGPSNISETIILSQIKSAISEGTTIVDAVEQYLTQEMESIKNLNEKSIEANSIISKYYVSSFAMKGCQGISWCTDKENILQSINENHLSTKRLINMIKNFTTQNTADIIISDLFSENIKVTDWINRLYKDEYKSEMPDEYKNNMTIAYEKANLKNEWIELKSKAESLIPSLKSLYNQCSEISYNISNCSDDYTNKVEELFEEYNTLYDKGRTALGETMEIGFSAIEQMEAKKATITLVNNSKHDFIVEIEGQNPVFVLGKMKEEIKVWAGTYTLKATQQNGYILWATKVEETIYAEESGAYTFSFSD